MAHLFEARNISKTFGPVTALTDVSLTLDPGDCHSIIGENGAGKSTLMNIFCGRFPPSEGTLLVDGTESSFAAMGAEAERRAACFQDARRVEISGAGHMIQRHQPLRLAEVLLDFLGD